MVLGEAGIKRHVHESAVHPRCAGERGRYSSVNGDDGQATRLLSDQHAPVRQECEAPGMIEAACHRLDDDLGLLGREELIWLAPSRQRSHREHDDGEDDKSDHSTS